MRRDILLAGLLGVALSAASPCMATTPAVPPALGCKLEIEGSPVAGGPAVVRLTLTNESDRPLHALAWGTPLEKGWLGSRFTLVGPDGNEIRFEGPMVKRGDPAREDYVTVPAHGDAAGSADLAKVYDLSRPGSYELRMARGLHDLAADGEALPRPRDRHREAPLACGPLRFTVTAR